MWLAGRAEQARVKATLREAKRMEAAASAGVTDDQVYFSADELPHLPAVDILDQHLSQLGSMTSEAERKFGGNSASDA